MSEWILGFLTAILWLFLGIALSRFWSKGQVRRAVIVVIVILVTGGIFAWQYHLIEKATPPDVVVTCWPPKNGNPTCLECEVTNSGRTESKDVYVGFTFMLPLDTKVFCDSEVGARLFKIDNPPDPNLLVYDAGKYCAFNVWIPRVAPGDTIEFNVCTTHPDNQRAGEQTLRILNAQLQRAEIFGEFLSDQHPDEAERWDLGAFRTIRVMAHNYFNVGNVSHEGGRAPVVYWPESLMEARDSLNSIYQEHKAEFIETYGPSQEFIAPVIRIETWDGNSTYGTFPPFVKPYLIWAIDLNKLRDTGEVVLRAEVPESYESYEWMTPIPTVTPKSTPTQTPT